MQPAIELHRHAAPHAGRAEADCRAFPVEPALLRQPSVIDRWSELAAQAEEPNPFLESWFLLPSLEHLAGAREVTVLKVVRDEEWIGLIPLARRSDYYGRPIPHFSTWLHANAFLGAPLVRQGMELAFWQAVLDWVDAQATGALFLHLPELPLDGGLAATLEQVAGLQGRACGLVDRYERPILRSDLGAEEYRQAHHPGRKRKGIRRRMKRLAEKGEVRFEWCSDACGIESWVEDFLTLESSGWKGRAGSALASSQATASFFREAVTGAAREGRAIRLTLNLDGHPIAKLVNFTAGDASFGFKTAFDEAHAACSPGVLLENEYLAALDDGRTRWSDSCAAADHPVMSTMWAQRRAIGKYSVAIGGRVRRALASPIIHYETNRFSKGAPR